jgi:hypothetical protein
MCNRLWLKEGSAIAQTAPRQFPITPFTKAQRDFCFTSALSTTRQLTRHSGVLSAIEMYANYRWTQ